MRLLPLRSIRYRGRFGNETPDNFDNDGQSVQAESIGEHLRENGDRYDFDDDNLRKKGIITVKI